MQNSLNSPSTSTLPGAAPHHRIMFIYNPTHSVQASPARNATRRRRFNCNSICLRAAVLRCSAVSRRRMRRMRAPALSFSPGAREHSVAGVRCKNCIHSSSRRQRHMACICMHLCSQQQHGKTTHASCVCGCIAKAYILW